MAGGLRYCRQGCADSAGNVVAFKGPSCSHRKKDQQKLPARISPSSVAPPLIFVPDAQGHGSLILPASRGIHNDTLSLPSAEEPAMTRQNGQATIDDRPSEPTLEYLFRQSSTDGLTMVVDDRLSEPNSRFDIGFEDLFPQSIPFDSDPFDPPPTSFDNMPRFNQEGFYPSPASSSGSPPTSMLSSPVDSTFDDLLSALQDLASSQDISDLQDLLNAQHISTEASNDTTPPEIQYAENRPTSIINPVVLSDDLEDAPMDPANISMVQRGPAPIVKTVIHRKRRRVTDSDIEDDNDEKDEAKYVENDNRRSKRHSERLARIMNALGNLDRTCRPYIFFYVSRPESILARNGKAKIYMSESMKAACGVDNKLGTTLHDKAKCHVEEQILSYETVAALNMSVQKAQEEKRKMEHQLAVQEKKAQEETRQLEQERAALEEQVTALRLREQMRQ